MKIGIIGATGMLGHHTAKAVLDAGYDLAVIHWQGSKMGKIKDLTFESRIGDLNDRNSLVEATKDLDYLLNCGAYYPTIPLPLNNEMTTAQAQMENFIEAGELNKIKKNALSRGLDCFAKSGKWNGA